MLIKKIILHRPTKQIIFTDKQWKIIESGLKKLSYLKQTVPAERITEVFTDILNDTLVSLPF